MEKYLIIQRIVLECKHFQIKSLGEYPRQATEFKKNFFVEENKNNENL